MTDVHDINISINGDEVTGQDIKISVKVEEEVTAKDQAKTDTNDKKDKKKRKCKDEEKKEQGSTKTKKPRVKPEKVQEVYQKIIDEMVKNYNFGMTEVPMDTLAAAVGYKHPRSDAILESMKLLKKDGWVEKTKDKCKFTDRGIKEYVPEAKPAANPEEAMEQFWKQLEMKLNSSPKSSGEKVHDAATNIWKLLKDGKGHAMKDVVGVTTYSMDRSTGFGEIMKALNDLGFTHKVDKKLQFTDKVFPFGRP